MAPSLYRCRDPASGTRHHPSPLCPVRLATYIGSAEMLTGFLRVPVFSTFEPFNDRT